MWPSPLAQTTANPFQGLEDSLYETIVELGNTFFTSTWYGTWLNLIGIFTSFFFLYKVIGKSFYLYISNKPGVLSDILAEYVKGIIIVLCIINVHVFVDFLFSLFRLFIDLGNSLISGTAGTAIDILGLINTTALSIQAQSFDPLSIVYGLSWFVLMFGLVLMGVFYLVNLGEAVFYLFIIFPFLARAGVMGLLLPQTSGWFGSITNLALEQMLKPLLGKVFFWLTLILLEVGTERSQALPSGIQSLLTQIAWLLLVIVFGVLLQSKVPTTARLLTIAARGAVGGIGSGGLIGALFQAGSLGLGAVQNTARALAGPAGFAGKVAAKVGQAAGQVAGKAGQAAGGAFAKTQLGTQMGRTGQAFGKAIQQEALQPLGRGAQAVGRGTREAFDRGTAGPAVTFKAMADSTERFNETRPTRKVDQGLRGALRGEPNLPGLDPSGSGGATTTLTDTRAPREMGAVARPQEPRVPADARSSTEGGPMAPPPNPKSTLSAKQREAGIVEEFNWIMGKGRPQAEAREQFEIFAFTQETQRYSLGEKTEGGAATVRPDAAGGFYGMPVAENRMLLLPVPGSEPQPTEQGGIFAVGRGEGLQVQQGAIAESQKDGLVVVQPGQINQGETP
ncbi:hypothetical protein [Candidatus Cyanaurora vandensis]|uniref:hypothetical protein n=1 Tax=Candidatus Cyanaurora vandensis TaxID=2714958 RepID=UPI00257A08D6|nr:hypothetical protein [Candidatus Cyanaurora vandensis]